MSVLKQRSIMTLFSGDADIYSHQVRIVLAVKDVNVDIISVDLKNPREDFLELSPSHVVPTLADREVIIDDPVIIKEYFDERFPYPPMLPVYPTERAKYRLMMSRIEKDWYSQVHIIEKSTGKSAKAARQTLEEALVKLAPVFAEKPYFLSNEFSLIDCSIAPLLWRLPVLGIDLPVRAKAVLDYADRLFNMPVFRSSLTDIEHEMRD